MRMTSTNGRLILTTFILYMAHYPITIKYSETKLMTGRTIYLSNMPNMR